MTYCVGWRYKDSVYLVADAAFTSSIAPTLTRSSFGELHDSVQGQFVQEGQMKIVPIGEGAAVAFAGDLAVAKRLITFLREHFASHLTTDALLAVMNNSVGPFQSEHPVELLIAVARRGDEPELITWESSHGTDCRRVTFCDIGSLQSYHAALTRWAVTYFTDGGVPEDLFLPFITAIVQSYGVHDNLIQHHVGGVIWGVRAHQGRVLWQEDTNYLLYDTRWTEQTWVTAATRDHAVAVKSSVGTCPTLVMPSYAAPPFNVWIQKWGDNLAHQFKYGACKYWVIIRATDKLIFVIRRADPSQGRLIMVLPENGELVADGGLLNELDAPLAAAEIDGFPLRFSFRND